MIDISSIYNIFKRSIDDYHRLDSVTQTIVLPSELNEIESIFYHKNWIDTIQWHYEDLIRDPNIDPELGIKYKRCIDRLNQERTDIVERIDDMLYEIYYSPNTNASVLATESPAWALDRLSILALKIYHFEAEQNRSQLDDDYRLKIKNKLLVLNQQKTDLIDAITILLQKIEKGEIVYKLYRQMKMYNDAQMNPVLRKSLER